MRRQAAGLEETGGPQPFVQSHPVHRASILPVRGAPRGPPLPGGACGRPARLVPHPRQDYRRSMTNPLYTIGHSNRGLDEFIDLLARAGIECLADIRTVPRSRSNPQFNRDTLPETLADRGIAYEHMADLGGLRVMPVPFVPQARFDELLWCCDLNFVRGEDSLVRALWAGAPLVWQIYRQERDAHLDKLEAWLERARWPAPAAELIRAWNRPDDEAMARTLPAALREPAWSAWRARSRAWCAELAGQPDLGQDLLDFCLRRHQTR
ncbi:MAG: elongation factor P maturation arginine rhamnosyltransferase EarP [Burkholderiales bacterium]|nr:elongation factor P maturation arginine rhamnosyltransferase EarP [Burkholderiales bacterium]